MQNKQQPTNVRGELTVTREKTTLLLKQRNFTVSPTVIHIEKIRDNIEAAIKNISENQAQEIGN